VTGRLLAIALAGLALAAACASAPQRTPPPACRTQPNESSVDIECAPSADEQWQEEVIDETHEGFKRRSPEGRDH
jgi:hypothetical protein